jgi:serine/threonine-protein kinase
MNQPSRPNTLSSSGPTAAAGPPAPDLTGRDLGDFRILRRLGEGGMGQVYLAEQLSLRRKVALKLLRPELAANPVTLQRFKIEAEAAARATHANIVQVYAIGEAEGLHYMALEYVEGRTLRDYLEKKGPPELLVALSVMRQVASALQRAHELGVIHRDIKPENILLTRRTEVKVADFGLSRIFAEDRQSPSLTQSNITMGTPLYMSPEQVESRTLDSRSDIYSFGVTCYHMFAGRPPFHGQTAFEVVAQHVQKEPPPLAQVRPDLPAELCALVHRMMAKRPEDRPQTGREVAREVGRLRDALAGVTTPRSGPVISVGPAPAAPTDAVKTGPVPALPRRRRLPWLVAGSLVLAVGAGGVLGWLQRRGAASTRAAAEASPPPRAVVNEKKEKEEFLKSRLKQYANPAPGEQQRIGLEFATELGLLYLKDRRLEDADQLFKDLSKPERTAAYRALAGVGRALVLSFQDHPRESNRILLFLVQRLYNQTGGHPYTAKAYWLTNPQLREAVAEAVNRNYQNAPGDFPRALEPLRFPPAPPPRVEAKARPAAAPAGSK